MRKVIAIMTVIALILGMSIPALSAIETKEELRVANEIVAHEQYEALLTGLKAATVSNHKRGISIDYYGGAYINADGNLVVCVTEDYDADSKAIEEYTGNDDIIIKYVKYTLSELENEHNRIYYAFKLLQQNRDTLNDKERIALSTLRGMYVDEKNNKLVIELSAITTENISAFQSSVSNMPYLIFQNANNENLKNLVAAKKFAQKANAYNQNQENSDIYTTSSTVLKPGYTIYTTSSPSTRYALSIGYPVYLYVAGSGYVRGFITSGCIFDVGDYVYAANGAVIGQCVRSKFDSNGDGALIRITNSSYSISATTAYEANTLSTYHIPPPIVGSIVNVEGSGYNAYTGHIKTGEIVSTTATAVWDQYSLEMYNMVQLYHTPTAGSGAPCEGDVSAVVYTASNGIVGTVSWGGNNAIAITDTTYVYKLSKALEHLNCELWIDEY